MTTQPKTKLVPITPDTVLTKESLFQNRKGDSFQYIGKTSVGTIVFEENGVIHWCHTDDYQNLFLRIPVTTKRVQLTADDLPGQPFWVAYEHPALGVIGPWWLVTEVTDAGIVVHKLGGDREHFDYDELVESHLRGSTDRKAGPWLPFWKEVEE